MTKKDTEELRRAIEVLKNAHVLFDDYIKHYDISLASVFRSTGIHRITLGRFRRGQSGNTDTLFLILDWMIKDAESRKLAVSKYRDSQKEKLV